MCKQGKSYKWIEQRKFSTQPICELKVYCYLLIIAIFFISFFLEIDQKIQKQLNYMSKEGKYRVASLMQKNDLIWWQYLLQC